MDYSRADNDPRYLAAEIDLAETLAFIAYETACQAGHVAPVRFDDFLKLAETRRNQWSQEKTEEISKAAAETREANKRNQTLGPRIIEETLKISQFVGSEGVPILDLEKVVCQSCRRKFDVKREAELTWEGMNGVNISILTEPELRKFVEGQIYQHGITRNALLCHNLVSTADWQHGRAILGSGRKQPCGNRILRDYRILPLEAKRR